LIAKREAPAVLIIDDDRELDQTVCDTLRLGGLRVESVATGFAAIEKLRERQYSAVVLDPMIRHGLNGYAVLDYMELEQPQSIERLFLLTGMSEQTIRRTAPSVLPRLFRKPSEVSKCAAAVLSCSNALTASARAQPIRPVLVVEDDYVTTELTLRLLTELGYAATAAHTVRDALRRLEVCDYAAILVDLVMPDVDGFALLDHLAATRPRLLSRIIVTTGMPDKYTTSIDVYRICGILRKPIDARELSALIDGCVSRQWPSFEGGGETPDLS
jgi:CheY-like chemotaxis protein